jgi:hypothetical protein
MPIRVAMLDLPPMLTEIVSEILFRAPDVVIADPAGPVDVLVLGARSVELPEAGWTQLARQPRARVLTVSADGRHAQLYEMRPQRTALGELSAETLLNALRSAETRPAP